ncbi:unnamed protein product [Didymodactylos carnosus]|uniref:Beta-lactamase-related domain-containing protein n=1 Tax=Didymodactylos carnosus TaxID=1234261 RepID=A0A8S2E7F1_9BILA|nr:unnamed protein product [Didymodactylos carnosus]CAF3847134.1 unnamed protein product [Didymodactylos carnosus]
MERAHIGGLSAVVLDKSAFLYQHSFGYEEIETRNPITNSSIFLLASISKTVIAVAAMRLVERNQLDLDKDINTYLARANVTEIHHPLYPMDKITMRHLLTHTSSINTNEEMVFGFYLPEDNYLNRTIRELVSDYLVPGGSLYHPINWINKTIGTQFHYSNMATSLAALIIEVIVNTSYDDYVRENIFHPLDVYDARFALGDQRKNLVHHYAYNSSLASWELYLPQLHVQEIPNTYWLQIGFFSFREWPAGLLRMSSTSLAKYLQMFLNDGTSLSGVKILDSHSVEVIRTIQYQNLVAPISVGLLWNYANISSSIFHKNRTVFGHRGSALGTLTSMLIDPTTNIGTILLTNADRDANEYEGQLVQQFMSDVTLHLLDCFSSPSNVATNIYSYNLLFLLLTFIQRYSVM